nr:MAG: hypothetical protein TU35_01805 [Thermoproteus sp. AZ2]
MSVGLDLREIPLIDTHNHLNAKALALSTYEDVVFYHYIVAELRSAGMPDEGLKLGGPGRLKAALPYFKYIRNTSTYWALLRILNDIYGLGVEEINEGNAEAIIKALEEHRGDQAEAVKIIRERAKVKRSLLTLNPLEEPPEYDPSLFSGALRLDPLIPDISQGSLSSLEAVVGHEVRSPADLRDAFLKSLERYRGRAAALTLNLQPDDDFFSLKPSDLSIAPFLKTLRERGVLPPDGRRAIAAFLLREALEYARRNKLVVQVMLGVKRPVPGADPHDYAITVFNPAQLLNLALLFGEYPDVKFDLIIADPLLNHAVAVIAKNYPNVFLNGYWWYSMYPEIISSYLRLRLQMLPYNKIGGFFSDAYVADWVYGKAVLVKDALSKVLAEFVERGYLGRDLALEIAEALLYKNAETLYGL